MFKQTKKYNLANAPTPMAGLALGIASIFWSWENFLTVDHKMQWTGAAIATILLLILVVKFVACPKMLLNDLAHPIVGSVVPTFAMACMVVANSLAHFNQLAGDILWCMAVALHIIFLSTFAYHRLKNFHLHHMVPSWFVPPVGIIVADVTYTGNPALHGIAMICLVFGMITYAIMLPAMIYRFIFTHQVPDTAKPTLAILAAPASLSLAGYLTVMHNPSPIILALLFGIAVLMTAIIYLSFLHLLSLPFSPGFAAYTFPMAIGATALYKLANLMEAKGVASQYVLQITAIANLELFVGSLVILFVALSYFYHLVYLPSQKKSSNVLKAESKKVSLEPEPCLDMKAKA